MTINTPISFAILRSFLNSSNIYSCQIPNIYIKKKTIIEHASEIPSSMSQIPSFDNKFLFAFFFFLYKNSMYISYVNTGRAANKCHDASQKSFSNRPKSRTSN